MPSGIISVVIAVLVIIVWIFLIRLFVYPTARCSEDEPMTTWLHERLLRRS